MSDNYDDPPPNDEYEGPEHPDDRILVEEDMHHYTAIIFSIDAIHYSGSVQHGTATVHVKAASHEEAEQAALRIIQKTAKNTLWDSARVARLIEGLHLDCRFDPMDTVVW